MPINSDRFSGKPTDKASSITSRFSKVPGLACPPTHLFKGLGAPFIPTYTPLLAHLSRRCHPCSLLKPTTSPLTLSLPSGGYRRKGRVFGRAIPSLSTPNQKQIQGGLLSPGCVVALPLCFDNAGHTIEQTKIKGWRLRETASKESWESTQGNRTSFLSSSPTHTTIKQARK